MAQRRRSSKARSSGASKRKAKLDARRDTVDFRDKMYVPTLVEVPSKMPLERYLARYGRNVPVLDQLSEGACTGFGLAAVANFLLHTRKVVPDSTRVSARMLYDMARRHDEWPGERYSGSSARGAMKGWHKHGVCSERAWPYKPKDSLGGLEHERALDAAARPLGAYFRVDHRDLTAVHAALAEVGILFATGDVHAGWDEVDAKTGVIPGPEGKRIDGGHAFAVVGYDERGFWIQNSWGPSWGKRGFALLSYDDWLANIGDVWVARLGVPTQFAIDSRRPAQAAVAGARSEFAFTDLRPHIVSLGNDGLLRDSGTFASTPRSVAQIFSADVPRITRNWPVKRVLLYAHGGLVSEAAALQRAEDYRKQLLDAQVYPISFVWHSDFLSTISNILKECLARRRPEGVLDSAKDFLLDRLDDTLELLAKPLGCALWDEMKENARLATTHKNRRDELDGGASLVLDQVKALHAAETKLELHIAGHSAGSIVMAHAVERLRALGVPIASVALWAPACTMALFEPAYLPSIKSGHIARFALFTLKDLTEQDDDCANIYHKSLLYLVSNAFEPEQATPILGMEKFIFADARTFKVNKAKVLQSNASSVSLFGMKNAVWVRSPNPLDPGRPDAARARRHGDFDDDRATVRATLARILNKQSGPAGFEFRSSAAASRERRVQLSDRRVLADS
jgi:hypothetical protein